MCDTQSMTTEEHFITLNEGTIFVKKWIPSSDTQHIDHTPIVLLHDSLGSVDLWRDFPALLAEQLQRPIIAYDRLGFGKSDARQALPSFEFISEEATQYFPQIKAQLGIEKFVLFGHSVGGGMAVHIAAHDADCTAVITVAAQAFVEDMTRQGIEAAKAQFAKAGQIERLAKWHGEKATWVLHAWTDIWLADEFRNWSLASVIRQVNCPVLAIHGSNDEYGSSAFPEYISQNVSGQGEMLLLADCGHVPHREKPQETVDAVADFLA